MIPFAKPTVEQFFRTYTITNFAVNGDESKLIFNTNLNGKMNLWAMDLPGSYPYLFAHRDESCNFIKFDPENRYVLAGYDKDGDENFQIYAIPLEGGLPQPLISGEADEKYYFSHLSDDGKRLYYITSLDNEIYLNTHMHNLESGVDTLLNIGEISPTELAAVSNDEEKFVYSRAFANTYVVSFVKIGEETFHLTPDPKKVHVAYDPVFTDDNTIYFVTDYESDHSYIAKFDLTTKSFSKVVEVEGESVQTIKWNKETGDIYFLTIKGVADKLYRTDVNGEGLEECSLPVDVIDQISCCKVRELIYFR